jgi:proline iminopeptidase
MLKVALIAVGSLIGIVVIAVASVGALLGVATVTDVPVVFLGAGLLVWAVGLAALAWVLARGRPHRRRAQLAVATGIIGAALGGLAISLPMGDPPLPAEPVAGMAFVDLPTGSRIAYVRTPAQGEDHGGPVVFIHGGPGVSDMAHDLDFFGELTEDDHDVILYDQVGTGHSQRLADPGDYTLKRDVDDLEALVHALGLERPIIIGHSYGTTLAAAYLARHPDAAERVIFLSPGAVRPGGEAYVGGMRARLDSGQSLRLYAKLVEPRALIGYLVTLVNPEAAAAWIGDAEFDARFDTLYALTSPGLTCDSSADLPKPHALGFFTNAEARTIPDLRTALSAVHVPALIMKPQCDYLPWSFGTDIARAMEDAELVYVRNAGHSLYVEQRDAVLAEIRAFLADEPLPIAPQASLDPPSDLDGPIGDPEP